MLLGYTLPPLLCRKQWMKGLHIDVSSYQSCTQELISIFVLVSNRKPKQRFQLNTWQTGMKLIMMQNKKIINMDENLYGVIGNCNIS